MAAALHVVFGGGQAGPLLAERLLAAGHRVRLVKRNAAIVPEGIGLHLGDATDPAFCERAVEGAAAVYHCLHPPYDRRAWAQYLPVFMTNLVRAAGRAGARLVVLDNVYALGRTGGRPLDEDTPPNPCSRKGEIRARVAAQLFEAHAKGEVRAIVGRASDFYGPRGTLTAFGDRFWPAVLAPKQVKMPLVLDTPHTYHYLPDVAAGLAALAAAPDDMIGRAWMLPCARAESTRAVVERLARALGRSIDAVEMPRWFIKATARFIPIVREVEEMLYQWDEPFVVDDRRIRERLGLAPTDPVEAARATVEWARQHYGGA
jgi:nucleoside-diphosphate-sugar epimerase